ncbi:hypothetical protein B0H19DRAFT_1378548 [Mycena capillaripes]|nr:hypothetical protein B0H19DRAFT_1378548 [Mycena capillaripes]
MHPAGLEAYWMHMETIQANVEPQNNTVPNMLPEFWEGDRSFLTATPLPMGGVNLWPDVYRNRPHRIEEVVRDNFSNTRLQSGTEAYSRHMEVSQTNFELQDNTVPGMLPEISEGDHSRVFGPAHLSTGGMTPWSNVYRNQPHHIEEVVRDDSSRHHALLRPSHLPMGVVNSCADVYRNRPHHIEEAVQLAKQTAIAARPHQLMCEWNNCGKLLSTADGALRGHLRDMHGVETGKVHCCWTGCLSNKPMDAKSILSHLKSNQHLRWSLHCPLCFESFAREDTLNRHLSGKRSH